MRYTTIIDLSEYASLYRNKNVRLVYLHMVLKSGWHDQDRDILDMSIRALSRGCGLSVSAVRHALKVLEKSQLVVRQGNVWSVKKWVLQDTPTPRPRSSKEKKQRDVISVRTQEQSKLDAQLEQQEAFRLAQRKKGISPFMEYYEDLMRRAAQGDAEAQELVKRHRAMYEQQKKSMTQ